MTATNAQPNTLRTIGRRLQYQLLTWFGIIGGAITLFSNLQGVLNLADWAHWLAIHWHEWTSAFWQWAFRWIGIRLPKELAPLLSLASFCLATAIGARRFISKGAEAAGSELIPLLIRRWFPILLITGAIIASFEVGFRLGYFQTVVEYSYVSLLILLGVFLVVVIPRSSDKVTATIFIVIFFVFYAILFGGSVSYLFQVMTPAAQSINYLHDFPLPEIIVTILLVTMFGFPALMEWICPIKPLTQRLMFLLLGVGILVGLNELSKYGRLLRPWLQTPT